jgi:hypothetical protein
MALAKKPAVIQLDEIVPGATVRFCVMDGVQYLSIRDFIMCVCGKNNKRACETWDNINQTLKDELSEWIGTFQFPGRGQLDQPVITFMGALKLMMYLPGDTAKQHRSLMIDILRRYFAGDMSLFNEIAKNAESSSPVAQMARESLVCDGVELDEIDDETYNKKRKFVELYKIEADAKCAVMGKQLELVREFKNICSNSELDPVVRDQLKDVMLKSITGTQSTSPKTATEAPAIANEQELRFVPKPKEVPVLTVLRVANELGVKMGERYLLRLDETLNEEFAEKYGEDAKDKLVRVNGKEIWLHTFYKQDRKMIADLVQDWYDKVGEVY